MEFNTRIFTPFGPPMLEADCPDFIVDALNEYHDTYHTRPNAKKIFPNLLTRSISNVFIETDFADDIGLLDYMEYLAQEYVKQHARRVEDLCGDPYDGTLDKFKDLRVSELDGNEEGYIDGWINVYDETDFTPIHTHGGELSSVMILKLPDDPERLNEITNDAGEDCPNGKLNYHYYPSDETEFEHDMYTPEQYVGKTLLFPPMLRHVYYPHKLKGQERRTLSLNFAINK
tara:strand:- start:445 stop:1134 length:690 start_codon:yes stop_codon:yes gene_type:complete